MNIDSIQQGIVLDHIKASMGLTIYQALHLDELDCSVAIIKNAKSSLMGRKDIIKIDDDIEVDLDILGFLDPGITVNIIQDGRIVEKKHLNLPQRIEGILVCKNPRCITSVEKSLPQVFTLTDAEHRIYSCQYCETKAETDAFR